jgi:CRISP-associated protein Cas1
MSQITSAMIKKTLYFSSPAYVHLENAQLSVRQTELGKETQRKIPIEDIGIVILDHQQITTTQGVIQSLLLNNACVVYCDQKHMPISYLLPLHDNDTYSAKIKHQLMASEPLKKQLWKQTVTQKIHNQYAVLKLLDLPHREIAALHRRILSGNVENVEGFASAVYWRELLRPFEARRGRYEAPPNHLFNYGYAILRSVIARNLVGSGCLPVLGIHHTNQYNPYCLADDIMEPFRPIVDLYIMQYLIERNYEIDIDLSKDDRIHMLNIPVLDIVIDKKSSPLMVGSQRTTASLVKCYMGELRKIQYPEIKC